MSKILGIDLGTTNSLVAVWDAGQPRILPNRSGARMTPSVVRFLSPEEVVVGQAALRARGVDPEHTITGIKRLMGRRYHEVFDFARRLPYRVVPGESDLAMVEVFGHLRSPQEISALLLKTLCRAGEEYLGERVEEVVITVPAYFNESQRQATREAGAIAGLNVRRLVREPVAAAFAYDSQLGRRGSAQDQRLAVFDLGGGTFDVTILEGGDGVTEVTGISGDGFLGGDNFDDHLATWIGDEIRYRHGVDHLPRETLQRIAQAATDAKVELSERQTTAVTLPFLSLGGGRHVSFDMELDRQRFEERCAELFASFAEPCDQALHDAAWTREDLDTVLLVGGATRVPRVAREVERIFSKAPSRFVNPDEAVALGAALQGGVIRGDARDELLLTVSGATLSIEDAYGGAVAIIPRHTTIPTIKVERFTTSFDHQRSVEIHLLEGECRLAQDNRSLGRLVLEELPPARRGQAQIQVTVEIDANLIINLSAKLGSGRTRTLEINRETYLLPPSSITELARVLPRIVAP